MIIYITGMDKLPPNCIECGMECCGLPLMARRYEATVKKAYRSKRHPDCTLSRSEERRGGKEGAYMCRSRWSPYH